MFIIKVNALGLLNVVLKVFQQVLLKVCRCELKEWMSPLGLSGDGSRALAG